MKKKGFTLIELIAVLVILAILALIVTPLVMNIIKKARISADKRSIDAYGRSIELAVASYLLDNGSFPTSIEQLTIEYSGDRVECSTTQVNSDSTVFLSGCTVGGRIVDEYTYGSDKTPPAPTYTAYEVGDQVRFNSEDYYVIKNSDINDEYVTVLKSNPLTYEEAQTYSNGVSVTINNRNGFAELYYSLNNNTYETSDVKIILDAWAEDNIEASYVREIRLIDYSEYENLGYEMKDIDTEGHQGWTKIDATPSWVYNSIYDYWTMSKYYDSTIRVWFVSSNGNIYGQGINYDNGYSGGSPWGSIRPVLVIKNLR